MGGLTKNGFLRLKPDQKTKALQWLQGETNITVTKPAPKADLKKERVGIIMFGQMGIAEVTDATYVGVNVTIQGVKIRELLKASDSKIDDKLGWGVDAGKIITIPPSGFKPAKAVVTLVTKASLETDNKRTSAITGIKRPDYDTASAALPFGRGTEASETGASPPKKTTIPTSDYYEVMQLLNSAIRQYDGSVWTLQSLSFKPEHYPTPDTTGALVSTPEGALKPSRE